MPLATNSETFGEAPFLGPWQNSRENGSQGLCLVAISSFLLFCLNDSSAILGKISFLTMSRMIFISTLNCDPCFVKPRPFAAAGCIFYIIQDNAVVIVFHSNTTDQLRVTQIRRKTGATQNSNTKMNYRHCIWRVSPSGLTIIAGWQQVAGMYPSFIGV